MEPADREPRAVERRADPRDSALRPRVQVEGGCPAVPLRAALAALSRSVVRFPGLVARGALIQPTGRRGDWVEFADGSSARIYRETVARLAVVDEPVVLVVGFRLRWVRGVGHRLFRAESVLNTPMFAGFPGFVSKLWLTHDQHGLYRGIYQWNGAASAHAYARALWWALAVASELQSIDYVVAPGPGRDELLEQPTTVHLEGDLARSEWWRPTGTFRHAG